MPELVDPLSLWYSLPRYAQERIGAFAIANEISLQGTSSDTLDAAALQFHETAANECYGSITQLVREHLLYAAFDQAGEPRRVDLNKLNIRQCTTCGCTESRACPGGCSWTGPTTCSACAPPEAA